MKWQLPTRLLEFCKICLPILSLLSIYALICAFVIFSSNNSLEWTTWVSRNMKTAALVLGMVAAIVVALRNSAENTVNLIYPIEFTADNQEIVINSFPYDIPCVSLMVPTSEHQCVWLINGKENPSYSSNDTYILLQPFGPKFARTGVSCVISETGMHYNLSIGDMCPCKTFITWWISSC